jgi:hypothetical protein
MVIPLLTHIFNISVTRIGGSHGGEYEDGCLLRYSAL